MPGFRFGPGLQREQERIGCRLFGDVEVACQPQRGGQHATPVLALRRCGGASDIAG